MSLELQPLIALFVVIDPFGIAPIFIGLTPTSTEQDRRTMARRAVVLAASILLFFAVFGDSLLRFLAIGIPAFRITGGILLFLVAIDMVFARHSGVRSTTPSEREEAERKSDVSVFPLAFPLIAGPGSLTTVLLLSDQLEGPAGWLALLGALAAALGATLVSLYQARYVVRLLGETGVNVITRLLGLILSAMAVQWILDGIHATFG